MKKRLLSLILVSFIIVLLVIAISLLIPMFGKNMMREKGYLEGHVSVGPLCPVEHNPPLPNCKPTKDTYSSWPIDIYDYENNLKVAEINPNSGGDYMISLPEGEYVVKLADGISAVGGSNLPQRVKISVWEIYELNITIDTGIL